MNRFSCWACFCSILLRSSSPVAYLGLIPTCFYQFIWSDLLRLFKFIFFVVMNTRGDSSSRRALDEEFFGIPLRTKGQTARLRQLKERPIKSTKWACPTMLNHLGIGQQFRELANAASLQNLFFSASQHTDVWRWSFYQPWNTPCRIILEAWKREWTESLSSWLKFMYDMNHFSC